MRQLIETIKIENRKPQLLQLHAERMNSARKKIFNSSDLLNLDNIFDIGENFAGGMLKCRLIYSEKIEKIEYEIYKKRKINSLKIIFCDNIDYSDKWSDRSCLETLFKMRGECDEILIIKNGLVSDTSFSNVVFYDGDKFYTPSSPLLAGVKRKYLLEKNIISEIKILAEDIKKFKEIHLINAMLDLGEIIVSKNGLNF